MHKKWIHNRDNKFTGDFVAVFYYRNEYEIEERIVSGQELAQALVTE